MTLTFNVDTDEKEEEIKFTNDDLDNDNFVSMVIGDKEYIISVDDLVVAGNAFNKIRQLNLERDK